MKLKENKRIIKLGKEVAKNNSYKISLPIKKSKKIPLEIERKFLLRKLPEFDKKVDRLNITQFYVTIDGKNVRYRRSFSNGKIKYYTTIKKVIAKGVFSEDEHSINAKKFIIDLSNHIIGRRIIEKVRYIYKYKGLKFEIDTYNGIQLITLEVELGNIKQHIEFPECIQKEIIIEVTGKKEFSNYNLSSKHTSKIQPTKI